MGLLVSGLDHDGGCRCRCLVQKRFGQGRGGARGQVRGRTRGQAGQVRGLGAILLRLGSVAHLLMNGGPAVIEIGSLRRQLDRFRIVGEGFVVLPELAVRVGAIGIGDVMRRVDLDRLRGVGDGQPELISACAGSSPGAIGAGKLRVEPDGLVQIGERLFVLVLGRQVEAAAEEQLRLLRIDFQRLGVVGDGPVGIVLQPEGMAAGRISRRILLIERNGRAEVDDQLVVVAGLIVGEATIVMGIDQPRVHLDGLVEIGHGQRTIFQTEMRPAPLQIVGRSLRVEADGRRQGSERLGELLIVG